MRLNSSGTLVSYDDYYPFGSVMRSYTASVDSRYKYTGKERDTETGYDYFGARYYDSRIGRWLQVDLKAAEYPSWSSYVYVRNNPILRIDPEGLDDYYYDQNGKLVEKEEDSWWHNFWNSDKYYVQGSDKAPIINEGLHYWEIESPLKEGQINGIVENTDELIYSFTRQNAAEGKFPTNIKEVLANSPEGQKWDFKNNGLDPMKLYVLENKGYKYDYVGNVAWGIIMANSGWPLSISRLGAGFYQNYSKRSSIEYWLKNPAGLGDDPRDSQAIETGYRLADKLK